MYSLKILLPFLFLPCFLTAQTVDDFADGNLSSGPAWLGDTGNFIVNGDLEMQLDAPAAGTSTIYLPVSLADSTVWEFLFRLDFDPSGSNSLRIALQSEEDNFIAGTNSGYFLFLGETGSGDAIQFYRLDAGVETLLATATPGAVATSPNVRVRMERQSDGTWTMLADYAGGFNFSEEFQVNDATYSDGGFFFGFQCAYTASRTDKFFFDDILVGELLPDTEAPVLLSAEAISATEVDVFFSEALDEISATEPSNFSLSGSIGNPAAAFLDGTDETLVHLSLGTPLTSQTDYVLTTNNIADLAGNISASQTAGFSFLEIGPVEAFDLLINEIMADPNPAIGLPDAEYVELFNASEKVIDLAGLGLASGGAPAALPSFLLFPGEYAIVCDDASEAAFLPFGNVVPLGTFPALSNSGDEVELVGPAGEAIHRLTYGLDTYGDAGKTDGGWSLELVNPLAPCTGEQNLRAAQNLLGGTPGQPNSVLNAEPDGGGPSIVRLFASQMGVDIFFSEILEKTQAEDLSNYQISNGVGILSAAILPPANDAVRLSLAAPLEVNVSYELQILSGLTDCLGNSAATESVVFALPENIAAGDLLLNEILFDPVSGSGDFVEIYNPADKIFNLGDLLIGNVREGIDTTISPIIEDRLIFPGEYAVFAESAADVTDFYEVKNADFILVNDLPAFNADAGNVTLFAQIDTALVLVDAFDYDKSFHAPLLDETKGVSLERIDPNRANDAANWHSAAAPMSGAEGYGTPTFLNSQFLLSGSATVSNFFDIPEKKLSPDGDGFQDFLVVNYETDQPGYSVRAEVFDAEGRPVKTLFNNEPLATEGFFRWDGDTDWGDKARTGIYILWVELFHPDGTVEEFKETCVVAFF